MLINLNKKKFLIKMFLKLNWILSENKFDYNSKVFNKYLNHLRWAEASNKWLIWKKNSIIFNDTIERNDASMPFKFDYLDTFNYILSIHLIHLKMIFYIVKQLRTVCNERCND